MFGLTHCRFFTKIISLSRFTLRLARTDYFESGASRDQVWEL